MESQYSVSFRQQIDQSIEVALILVADIVGEAALDCF